MKNLKDFEGLVLRTHHLAIWKRLLRSSDVGKVVSDAVWYLKNQYLEFYDPGYRVDRLGPQDKHEETYVRKETQFLEGLNSAPGSCPVALAYWVEDGICEAGYRQRHCKDRRQKCREIGMGIEFFKLVKTEGLGSVLEPDISSGIDVITNAATVRNVIDYACSHDIEKDYWQLYLCLR